MPLVATIEHTTSQTQKPKHSKNRNNHLFCTLGEFDHVRKAALDQDGGAFAAIAQFI
jgi:hypothetical protein